LFDRDDVLAQNEKKAAMLMEALSPLRSHDAVRHLRQTGTIIAFDAAIEGDAARTFSRRFFEQALSREVLLRPIGTTVYLMPPYILDTEAIALLGSRTCETFEATLAASAS
jgi:adenosylmethionine-8-amino-7-oxononanoate aminotransferase